MMVYCMSNTPLKEYQGQLVPSKFDVHQADDQGECPHCYEKAKDRFFYSPEEDSDCFVGFITPTPSSGRDNQFIAVFKCRNCNEEFWCHNPNIRRRD